MSRAPDRANPWRAKSTVNGLPVDSMAFWISNNLTRLIDLPSFLFGVHFEVFSRLSWLQIVRVVVKTFEMLSSKIIEVLTPHSIYRGVGIMLQGIMLQNWNYAAELELCCNYIFEKSYAAGLELCCNLKIFCENLNLTSVGLPTFHELTRLV